MNTPEKKKKNNKWSTFLLLLIFFVGLSVMLYPSLSNFWNQRTQSEAIVDYETMLEYIPEADYTALFAAAEQYNKSLYAKDFPLVEYTNVAGYHETLNLNGNGMMGYVTIGKIGVELPLYHGTDDSILNVAIGHLEGSSLPIGGESTHAVVSAHRGLPSAKLFTDLDRMEVGDTFQVTILDRTLTYQVDQIRIVAPNKMEELSIVPGEDLCTLLTCTPYGINTDRLLVRGKRIETVEQKHIHLTSDAYQIDVLIVTPIVALPMLLVLMLIVLFKPIKKESAGKDLLS
ncbi:MAG: class C sortase [Clostridia bacterium]|nr:class C sortase [Clostridia bacterium]MBQ8893215.1 class C sortase [Clostridia bacterium]